MAASDDKFCFQPLKERFDCLEESKESLEKWYIFGLVVRRFHVEIVKLSHPSLSQPDLLSFIVGT